MERINTGFSDKHDKPICEGDVVEFTGRLRVPRRYLVFKGNDGSWRLDESGDGTAVVFLPLSKPWFSRLDYEVIDCDPATLKAWNKPQRDEVRRIIAEMDEKAAADHAKKMEQWRQERIARGEAAA